MEIGGIDANQIVTDLMALERRPLAVLEQRQSDAELASRSLSGLRSTVDAFRFAAAKLSDRSSFSRFSATTSNATAVSVSASSGAVPSSLTFSVTQLAASHGLRSVDTVNTVDTRVTNASTISIATGNGPSIGVGMVRAGATLAAGEHDVSVVQASSAAVKRSDAPLTTQSFGTGLLGTDPEFVTLDVDGTSTSIRFDARSYTAAEIADTISQGLASAGLAASASIATDGRLVVSTHGEGSAHSVQFTGGPLAKLQSSVDASAITGADAIVEVAGTSTTISSAVAGSTVSVATPDGQLELDLVGGLRLGLLDVDTIDVGGGTLSDVTAAVNNSRAGVTAAAIRTGDSAWRLQLGSRTPGVDGSIMIDDSVLSGIGGLIQSSAARNAEIEIGEGAGAYTVSSSSNTFSDVMAGTSLTVAAVTTSPVTVDVSRNTAGLSADVAALVSAANKALAEIKVQTRYGVSGTGDGALAGNSAVRRLADELRAALGRPVAGVSGMIGADVGIETKSDGSFTFDAATFVAALDDDPAAVARFFGRGATAPTGVSFEGAAEVTATGSYAIEVTTAATRATSARFFDGGSTSSARLGVRVGDTTVTVDIASGRSAGEIVDSLNDALGDAGLDIVAATDGSGLIVHSTRWGAGGAFELNLDVSGGGPWDAVTGIDVAGTIGGVAATGIGRTLSLNALVDSPAAGLSVTIDGGVAGSLGSVSYEPGVAARVAEVTTRLLGDDGTFDSATRAQQRRIDDFNDQIERFEDKLFTRETNMRRQWANLQTLLEGLQQQGSWLTSQIASLPSYNNN